MCTSALANHNKSETLMLFCEWSFLLRRKKMNDFHRYRKFFDVCGNFIHKFLLHDTTPFTTIEWNFYGYPLTSCTLWLQIVFHTNSVCNFWSEKKKTQTSSNDILNENWMWIRKIHTERSHRYSISFEWVFIFTAIRFIRRSNKLKALIKR